MKKLTHYIGAFKAGIFVVMLFAICSTIFNVVGPKILGKATTALSEGLMAKIQGTGGIVLQRIGMILLFTLGLYLCSAIFNFIQGWIMTRHHAEGVLSVEKRDLRENEPDADEIFREPYLRRSAFPYYQ